MPSIPSKTGDQEIRRVPPKEMMIKTTQSQWISQSVYANRFSTIEKRFLTATNILFALTHTVQSKRTAQKTVIFTRNQCDA